MAPALLICLFLIFIPLSHGQSNSTTSLTNTTTSVPSQYSVPSTASTVGQPNSVLFSSSHPVSRTPVIQGDVSSAVPSPSPSINRTTALVGSISGTIASSTPLLVNSTSTNYSSSSIANSSGQLLGGNRTLVSQQKSSIMKTSGPASSILATNARKPTIIESSSNNVSIEAPRTSKSEIISRAPAASLSSSRLLPNPTSSQNLTSRGILNLSSTPAARTPTNSPSIVLVNGTVSPGEPNLSTAVRTSTIFSTEVTLNSTSSPLIMNQTSFSVVMRNLSATPTVRNMTSSSSKTSASFTSVSLNLTAVKSSAVKTNKTATSVILNVTSTRLVKSMMPSVVLTNRSSEQRSTAFQNSSTAANEPSCYTYNSSRSCIKLQPSSTVHYKPTRQGINLTTSVIQSGSVFFNISSMTSGGKESSMYKPTSAPGPKDEEETHTPLIVGLAVGLSLGVLIIIIVIVYYRRKRASYQYNVFYDEQNIVMHPFDYSK